MSKASILVVEDEVIIAMEIENSLHNLGYEVTSIVNSGDQAIKKVGLEEPDLILMDIRINGDKDGIETAEIIRKRFGIPVVFSTAYLDEKRIERAKITMPFGYVLKPIQERDLKVTLDMALYVASADKKRKYTESKLQVNEQKLNTIFSATSDYIALFEVKPPDSFKYAAINDAYFQAIGMLTPNLSREDIEGMEVRDFGKKANHPEEFVEEIMQIYHRAINSKSPQKKLDIVPSLEGDLYLESTYTPIFDNEDNCTHILFVSHDITLLKRNEIKLEKQLEEKEKLIRKMRK